MKILNTIRQFLSLESYIAIAALISVILYNVSGDSLWAQWILIVVIIVGLMPLVYEIIQSVMQKEFGVDVIALLAIISALLIGEYTAAGLVLLMLSGGEALERFAEGRARSSLSRLLATAPTKAHVEEAGSLIDRDIQDVGIDSIIIVKTKEIIPLDGVVIGGKSTIDESMITGEPLPREVSEHAQVYSGSLNQGEVLHIRTTKSHENSVLSSIVRLVKSAEEHKSPMVRMADRYAVIFTAVTLAISGYAYLVLHSAYLAVAVLVVATPCPLILAAPIAFIAGMSKTARRGIIVKHGGVFEAVSKAKAIFFDKTGTLTYGIPKLAKIIPVAAVAEGEILHAAGSLEQLSTHIVARGILERAKKDGIGLSYPTGFEETYGKGVVGEVNSTRYAVGKAGFMETHGITVGEAEAVSAQKIKEKGGIAVFVAKETNIIGIFEFEDVVRDTVLHTLEAVGKEGYETVLVTGDTHVRAEALRKATGMKTVYAELLPEGKVAEVKAYQKSTGGVVMVGDGVNDAPALATANVGVALGSHGESASTDTADAVIVVDDIDRVHDLVRISKNTVYIAQQSILAGIGMSVIAMFFALSGHLAPATGAFVQEAIDVVVILNALRVLRLS